jgi:regulator of RNase E activity RraA
MLWGGAGGAQGVVAIPRQVADEVADESLEQARKDAFALLELLRQRCVQPCAV